MIRCRLGGRWAAAVVGAYVIAAATGCHSVPSHAEPIPDLQLPRELDKVSHPIYVVEAPDILLIDATRLIPKPPYKVQPFDALYLKGNKEQIEAEPLDGIYPIESDGTINLGQPYGGVVRVVDRTTKQLEVELTKHVRETTKNVQVTVSLASVKSNQQIAGQHLIRPDGTVGLGTYGNVYVAGMTLNQAKLAIEEQLGQVLYRPEVSVDVYAFNSKRYYIITDFAGNGEQVVPVPATGNETVLDAIAKIGGLSPVSSKKIWIARPAPPGMPDQILPVNWKSITRRGHTGSNYQVLPGDRVFVMASSAAKFDTYLGRAISPFERAFGFSLLGFSTFKTFETSGNQGLFGNNGSSGTGTGTGTGTTTR